MSGQRRLSQVDPRAGVTLNPVTADDLVVRLGRIEELLKMQLRLPLGELDYWLHSFVITIPANTAIGHEVSDQDRAPFDGRIKQIVLHFPSGPQGLAGVFLEVEGEQVFPPRQGQTIALDDATIPYNTDIFVSKGYLIRFRGNNADLTNQHTIRAQVILFEEPVRSKDFG